MKINYGIKPTVFIKGNWLRPTKSHPSYDGLLTPGQSNNSKKPSVYKFFSKKEGSIYVRSDNSGEIKSTKEQDYEVVPYGEFDKYHYYEDKNNT